MSNYRLAAVAVFCLALGFVGGWNFAKPVQVTDDWIAAEDYGLSKIQSNLESCLMNLRESNYPNASVYASDALDHCKSLRGDLRSRQTREDSLF